MVDPVQHVCHRVPTGCSDLEYGIELVLCLYEDTAAQFRTVVPLCFPNQAQLVCCPICSAGLWWFWTPQKRSTLHLCLPCTCVHVLQACARQQAGAAQGTASQAGKATGGCSKGHGAPTPCKATSPTAGRAAIWLHLWCAATCSRVAAPIVWREMLAADALAVCRSSSCPPAAAAEAAVSKASQFVYVNWQCGPYVLGFC